jgi:hypothetical protein
MDVQLEVPLNRLMGMVIKLDLTLMIDEIRG